MRQKMMLLFLTVGILFSCSENRLEEDLNVQKKDSKATLSELPKLNACQAEAYASMFSSYFDENDTPDSKTRASIAPKELEKINYFIENGDTLLYAFNYKNNQGYILLSADNSSFPILAHANQGNIDLTKIDKDSPFYMFVKTSKDRAKANVKDAKLVNSEYFNNWKDLGKDGYEYEVVLTSDEPTVPKTRGRRENSSGKESIYPYSGKDLDGWSQRGGFNLSAPNYACIGCPAIAVGMLLYDTSERMLGNMTSTYPSFGYYDRIDISSYTTVTETARKLRQVADSIPNYSWGQWKDAESGAAPANILTGLKKIGYKKAQLVSYDFETLYQNLKFKGYNYFGGETEYNRGVLIGAYSQYGGGHIWFCDGYYEQSYTVKKKFLGIVVKEWKEYDDRLYINWGWGPNNGNGWYCATDNVWTSLEGNSDVYYKYQTMMYINLSSYEYPRYH